MEEFIHQQSDGGGHEQHSSAPSDAICGTVVNVPPKLRRSRGANGGCGGRNGSRARMMGFLEWTWGRLTWIKEVKIRVASVDTECEERSKTCSTMDARFVVA